MRDCVNFGEMVSERNMPAALDVNKEAVQVLVGAVGVREAARQMGLSENTVLAWANRGGWVQHIANAKERKVQSLASNRPDSLQSPAIKPADALQNVLQDDSRETRISLSKSTRRLAKDAESAPLEQAGDVLQVAKTASLIHGWAPGAPATGQAMVLNINVLGASPDQHPVTLDLPPDEPPDEPPVDPMDSF